MPAWTKVLCEICNQEISKSNYSKHLRRHAENPKSFEIPKYRVMHDGLNCQFCNMLCKNDRSLRSHEFKCKLNPERVISPFSKELSDDIRKPGPFTGHQGWNKGLTADTDPRVAQNAASLKRYYQSHAGTFSGKHHTEQTKHLISQKLTEHFHDDANRACKGYRGYYDNVYFMSTYELALYIWCKDHHIHIKRCSQRFPYIYNDKKHYYYPDFEINDHIIEVKGWEKPQDLVKYEAVPNLVVLHHSDILPLIEYIKTTYNVDNLQELYRH